MNRKSIFILATIGVLLAGLAFAASPTLAGERISYGEAMSLLRAWNNGRIAILMNNGVGAVHFDDPTNVAILPFGSFDGRHYCVEDHQVAMIGWISSNDNYPDAKASLDTVTQQIVIDGQQQATIRTPVVNRVGGTYGFSEGTIIAPGDLSAGQHTLEVPIYFDNILIVTLSIDFFIDAAGTGACQ